jgi:UDP-glucose 4-epimerase
MRVLVSGGAGYIGSVVAAHLLVGGHDVTVLDDLSTGHEDAVPNGAAFIRGTVSDKAPGVLAERGIEALAAGGAPLPASRAERWPAV